MQDKLREEIRSLKVYQNIPYCEIADRLKIHRHSFYNFMKGYYDLSDEKARTLKKIIDTLKK